jgi:hypothetical protein
MKHFIISTSIFFLTTVVLKAIPVLTQSTFSPGIGEVAIGYAADTSINPGGSGANVAWTFNNLVLSGDSFFSTGVTPASTPFSSSFPSSTIAYEEAGDFDYINSTSGIFQILGSSTGSNLFYYTPALTYMTFPFTFGSTCSTPAYTQTTVQDTFTGSLYTTADAYGTVIINGRTFNDVLRIKIVQDVNFVVLELQQRVMVLLLAGSIVYIHFHYCKFQLLIILVQ